MRVRLLSKYLATLDLPVEAVKHSNDGWDLSSIASEEQDRHLEFHRGIAPADRG